MKPMSSADQPGPARPPRTWRPILFWTAGILAVLGLVWFVGAVVVPWWQVRTEVDRCRATMRGHPWRLAVERLGGPQRAVPKLALYLRLPEAVAGDKWVALHLLGNCGEAAVPLLLDAACREARARPIAAFWFGSMGRRAREAVPFLIGALEDADAETRANAADSLVEILWELETQLFVPDLTGILAKGRPDSRRLACIVLGKLRERAASGVPELERALLDEDERVRTSAAEALEKIRAEKR